VALAAAVVVAVVVAIALVAVAALRVAAIVGASSNCSIGYGCGWIALRFNRSRFLFSGLVRLASSDVPRGY
jgi:hypothetical protein